MDFFDVVGEIVWAKFPLATNFFQRTGWLAGSGVCIPVAKISSVYSNPDRGLDKRLASDDLWLTCPDPSSGFMLWR